ncbi:MAG: DUF1698 domain-containing protein [Planctomycetes bacterium]|nr:DUF1698 domain-containing protein [Planctomycetota bacterium]
MSNEEFLRKMNQITWIQSIVFPDGSVSRGAKKQLDRFPDIWGIPDDLAGKSVLEVGAADGYFSFLAEIRGAQRVVAFDEWIDHSDAGFRFAKHALGSNVEQVFGSVRDLSPLKHGRFDVVFCFGLLSHVRDPLSAIENIASVTRGVAIIETAALLDRGPPAARFYPQNEYEGDYTNWWVPNLSGLKAMILSSGFKEITCEKLVDDSRAVIHAKPRKLNYLERNPEIFHGVVYKSFAVAEIEQKYRDASKQELLANYDNAVRIFESIADNDQAEDRMRAGALFHLAAIAGRLGNAERAADLARECLEIHPGHESAARLLDKFDVSG